MTLFRNKIESVEHIEQQLSVTELITRRDGVASTQRFGEDMTHIYNPNRFNGLSTNPLATSLFAFVVNGSFTGRNGFYPDGGVGRVDVEETPHESDNTSTMLSAIVHVPIVPAGSSATRRMLGIYDHTSIEMPTDSTVLYEDRIDTVRNIAAEALSYALQSPLVILNRN